MRNKLILFLMLALFGSASFLRADELTVCEGTETNSYVPVYGFYADSYLRCQYVMPAEQLTGMNGGTISEMRFALSSSAAEAWTGTFQVYMAEVGFTEITAFQEVENVVYEGTLDATGSEMTVTFTTPYVYHGGNLLIGFDETTTGNYKSSSFYGVVASGACVQGYSYSSLAAVSPTQRNFLPQTTFVYTAGGGGAAGELTVHDASNTSSYVPAYGFYADAYLKCEMVYPATELTDMANGTINSVKFYASSPATEAWTGTWQVFVAEVADATISDFYGPGTVVYEGALDATQAEMLITFTTPYAYNGGNLLIGVYETETGNYKSVTWTGETVNGASVQGYNYSSLSGISATQRNFLPKTTFAYVSGSTPQPPVVGELAITPNPFVMGFRPVNGWMQPVEMRIFNGKENTVTMTGNMSNTAGVNAFEMSEEIDNVVLEPEEEYTVTIDINRNAAPGDYTEQFTLFYAENSKDITVVPVTATIYEAGEADIVETAKTLALSYTAGVANFDYTPVADLYANYFNDFEDVDAVFQFNLVKDALFSVSVDGGEFIGIYKKVNDFHPTLATEPVVASLSNEMEDEILLAGQYYMIVAGDAIGTVAGTVEQIPAPTEITNVAPADGAIDIAGTVTLEWTGGENATQYMVMFGTSPTSMNVLQDWTLIDESYGNFEVGGLASNTQYFWQVYAKNSNGIVNGPRWGFTTTLIAPNTVTASETEIFTDGSTLIKWKLAGTGGFSGELTVADGTATNSNVPVYGLWMDYYTRGEMIYPAEMLEEMEGGEITSMKFYISSSATGPWTGNVYQVYLAEVDATTLTSYYTEANATVVYTGGLDGQGTEMEIVFDETYQYQGGNLLVGIAETVKGTWKSCSFYGVEATGASASGYNSSSLAGVTFNQRNFLPKVTFTCGARNIHMVESTRTHQGFNVYYGGVKANTELITEKQYLLSNLPYNVNPGHDITVTAVYDEGESNQSDPAVVVKVSGYGTFTGTVTELISGAPLAGVNVKFAGKDEFNNSVTFEGTTNANGVYTINNVKAGNYTGTATFEGMEPKTSEPVTLAYAATETVDFVMHEVYVPVLSVVAEEMDSDLSRVKWSLNVDIPVPNPGGNTPGGGGSASSFTEGFEGGMPAGWSVIDGNNDGWTWCLTSAIPSTWTYYASLTLDWYRTGTNAICSGSYINGVGALTPNEYLVMGQQNLVNGSTLSFWAAATDASYPADHFGVAVSDNGTDWTMVQEWTLTAKGGTRNGGRESRDGNGAKLGTWYNYSVDLSAYAGQKYIAIRHFNCTDQYIMVVDDIELSASKGTRDVQRYALYRKAILKQDELVPTDSVMISDAITDTLYADFDWANMEPGLYQYGVSAIYPTPAKGGNRDEVIIGEGTGTSSYVPTYNLYNYSCTNQIYTGEEIGGAGTINSIAFMPATVNTTSRNLNVYMVNTEKTSFAGATDWIPVTDADLVYSGTVNWTANAWSTITLTNPFAFDGSNLCVVVNDLTGSWTSSNSYKVSDATAQAIRIYQDSAPYNPAAPGSGTVLNVKNNIKLDITYGGGGSGNDDPVTPITWSNVLPKDIETTVILNAQVPDASAEGVTVRFDNTFENTTFTVTLDETGTDTITDFRKGEYIVTFHLDGYTTTPESQAYSIWEDTEITAVFEEIFKPATYINATRSGYVTWEAVIPTDRVAESYLVRLDGAEYAETTYNYIQIDQDILNVGQTYGVDVYVMYTTGISTPVHGSFTYADCSSATHQVEDLTATNEPGNTNVTLAWNGATPTPPTPPTPPTGGWTEGFENGMPSGWNVVDGNNDGWTWCLTSAIPSTWTYYASLSLDWYRTGSNAICSGSYINGVGALTPNEYLVMGQQTITAGSTLSFWAAAADASYPADHFGVFVSDDASNWTSVQEWTLTGKGGNTGGRESRDGKGAKLGSWHQFTADLSAYTGTKYIAIRHFNCNDQYIMVVDDIEFTTAAKLGGTLSAAGVGFGAANNALTDDGNWYYYDNGTNEDAIGTNGGNFWWGIMLPAGSYEGNRLTKVAAYDYMAMSGTASIYQGGTSAPAGSALGTVNVTLTGSDNFVEFEFAEPVEIDPDQNVWVIFYNGSGATYPAAVCANTGSANGRWVSLDGSTWEDLASYSLNYTFMVRAYIESGSGPAPTALVPNKYNIFFDGELVGATAGNTFTYDAADFDEHEYVVIWVDADGLESCVDDENDIFYAAAPLGVGENMVATNIYPNPTNGNIRINASSMVRISIVNALGQVVYDKAVEGDEAIINMAQFSNGVYMVNIATENGTSVQRVVVSK